MMTSVAFSPDGQLLVTGCANGTVKLWNAQTGLEITTFKGHDMWVSDALFLPGGQTIVSAGQDGNVKFWEVDRKGLPAEVEYHSATWNATSVEDSLQDGAVAAGFLRQDCCNVCVSPDGSRLATLDDRAIVQVWDGEVQKSLGTRALPDTETVAAALFPDDREAVSVGMDCKLRLWDLTSKADPTIECKMDNPATRLAVSENGRWLATAEPDARILMWDTSLWKTVATNGCGPGEVTALKFFPDAHVLLAAILVSDGTNALVRMDLATHTIRCSPEHHKGMVTSLALSPDGRWVAGSSRDGIVRLWDSQTLVRVGTFRGHSGYVTSAAFSPDGRTLATASNDGTVKLWAVESRQELLTLPGHIAPWTQVAFAPDGDELVACGEAGLLRVWRAAANRGPQ